MRGPRYPGARADGHRDQLRRHGAAARARLPQLAAHHDDKVQDDVEDRAVGVEPDSALDDVTRPARSQGTGAMTTLLVLPGRPAAAGRRRCASSPALSRAAQRVIGLTTLTALVAGHDRHPGTSTRKAARSSSRPAAGRRRSGSRWIADRLSAIMWSPTSVVLLAVLVYAIGQPGAERDRVGVPVDVHDPRGRRGGVVPHRRPVHAVRRHRDDAHRELRAADARRSPRAGPRRHDRLRSSASSPRSCSS